MTVWPESLAPCSNLENSPTLILFLVYAPFSKILTNETAKKSSDFISAWEKPMASLNRSFNYGQGIMTQC